MVNRPTVSREFAGSIPVGPANIFGKIGGFVIEVLNEKIKQMLKLGEGKKVLALKGIKNELIKNQKEKNPKAELDVVMAYHKMLLKAAAMYSDPVVVEGLRAEICLVEEFLPSQLSREEVTKLIKKAVAGVEVKNLGAIMKIVMPQVKGKFDGSILKKLIEEELI